MVDVNRPRYKIIEAQATLPELENKLNEESKNGYYFVSFIKLQSWAWGSTIPPVLLCNKHRRGE